MPSKAGGGRYKVRIANCSLDWSLHKGVGTWTIVETLIEHLVECPFVNHLGGRVVLGQKRGVISASESCTVARGKDVRDGPLYQISIHASRYLSLSSFRGWLNLYPDQNPQPLPTQCNDGNFYLHKHLMGLIPADSSVLVATSHFIQRGCSCIWVHCTRSCVGMKPGRCCITVQSFLKGRAVGWGTRSRSLLLDNSFCGTHSCRSGLFSNVP